jgi:glycosyltransferase involved in cell wall biosynthesis
MQKLVSLIVPAYNEAANVKALYLAVKDVFVALPNYRFELLFMMAVEMIQQKLFNL